MQNVIEAVSAVYKKAHDNLKAKVVVGGRLKGNLLNDEQLAAHALAYLATELEACRQLSAWAETVGGEFEGKVARAYIGELARNLRGEALEAAEGRRHGRILAPRGQPLSRSARRPARSTNRRGLRPGRHRREPGWACRRDPAAP